MNPNIINYNDVDFKDMIYVWEVRNLCINEEKIADTEDLHKYRGVEMLM